MPEMVDFDQLRREVDDSWQHLQRDDRVPLKDVLRHLVDAIEAVSPPDGWTSELLTLAEFQAKLDVVSTERRERAAERAVRQGIVLPRGPEV